MLRPSSYFSNTSVLMGGRLVKMAINFTTMAIVARFLGVQDFGQLMYAFGFASLFSGMASLGVDNILPQELAANPNDRDRRLGAAWVIKIAGAVGCFLLASSAALLFEPNRETQCLIILLSASAVFQSFAVIQFFFEASVAARYVVWAETAQAVVIAAIRLALVMGQAPLVYFALSLLLEPALLALGLWCLYVKTGHRVRSWSIDREMLKGVARRALPMALAGVAIALYQRTDIIMLRHMLGETSVGIYAAATRICALICIPAMLLTRALTPALVEGDRMGSTVFRKRYQLFMDLILWVSLMGSIVLVFSAGLLISLFFGNDYVEATPVLRILAWKGVCVAMGYATAQWILIRSLHDYAPVRNIVGCVSNILLNFVLIPRYGAGGAAMASVASLALATTFVNGIIPALRPAFMFQLSALSGGIARLFRFRGTCEDGRE